MSEQETAQSQLAKSTARSRISPERWEQIKTAYASGLGLREIARNMGIPEGTVLATSKTRRMDARDSIRKGAGEARGCRCCHSG